MQGVKGEAVVIYAFIGAGAVVTKDVPDYALMLGNPATIAGWICECGHKIQFQDGIAICNDCGKEYVQTGEDVSALKDRKNAYRDVKKAL